jgi:hypothetical protein
MAIATIAAVEVIATRAMRKFRSMVGRLKSPPCFMRRAGCG